MDITVESALGADLATHHVDAGAKIRVSGSWVPDGSVSAGGETIAITDFETALSAVDYDGSVASAIDGIDFAYSESTTYYAIYNVGTGKVQYFQRSDEAEATGDLSGETFHFDALLSKVPNT